MSFLVCLAPGNGWPLQPLPPFPFAFLFQRPGGRLLGKQGEEEVGKEVRTALDFLVPRLEFTEGTLAIPVTVSEGLPDVHRVPMGPTWDGDIG